MNSFSSSILIKRPQTAVFAFVTNPANSSRWHVDVTDDDGPVGLATGSEGKVTIQTLGTKTVSRYKVIENNGRDYLRARTVQGPIQFDTHVSIRAVNGSACRVAITASVDCGVVFRLAESILTAVAESHVDADLGLLKHCLENDVAQA